MKTMFTKKKLTALLVVLALCICVIALASCDNGEDTSSAATSVSSEASSSEASSVDSSSEATSSEETSSTDTESSSESGSTAEVTGAYTSTEGDGEILTLAEDGTFISVTVTELGILNSKGEEAKSTETTIGTYTYENGVCMLKATDLFIKVEGLEGEDEIIAENAALLASDDEELALYTRMLGGEELSGAELYGEEVVELLFMFELEVNLDRDTMSFSYNISY